MNNSDPLALYNGSYLSKKPTGIGVVVRDLVSALNPGLVSLLDPLGGTRPGSIPIPSNLMPEYGFSGHVRRLIWTQREIPKLLKQSGAPLLLTPLPEAPLLRGVKYVALAYDLLPLRYPQFTPLLAYHLAYVPIVLHRASRVLCISEATARELHTRLGIPRGKLITIPLGFNPKKLCPLDLHREGFFLVLGRHNPHKNIARVIRAMALLKNKEVELWIVGPQDKRYTPRLRQLAVDIGVDHRCRWIPWVSDEEKLSLLNLCQALVIASLWEGFGLPALEAMACDTPVISSGSGALLEVVADAALLIDPLNSDEIADAMMQIISDNALCRSLILKGRRRLNEFKWDKTAKLVEETLIEVQSEK